MEPIGLKKYLLIRIGLDADGDTWFGERLGMPEAAQLQDGFEELSFDSGEGNFVRERVGFLEKVRWILGRAAGKGQEEPQEKTIGSRGQKQKEERRSLSEGENNQEAKGKDAGLVEQKRKKGRKSRGTKGLERRCLKKVQLEREVLRQELEERQRRTESAIRRLTEEVQELAGTDGLMGTEIYCVYEDGMGKALLGQSVLGGLWQKWFSWKIFEGYADSFWAEQLMDRAVWPRFVVLGMAECIPEIIERHAVRMKSLRWIIPEADCTEEVQEFVEDFYTESGLAIALQTIPSVGEFKRMQLLSELPANILDFTREPHIVVSGLAEGSVWIDMQSMEEKRRRIQGRDAGTVYVSLKEKWKYAQRRCKNPVLS